MKKIYFTQILAVSCVFIFLVMFGCGGGGGGSAIDLGARSAQTSNISVKMNMLNYSDGTSFVSIPTGITGRVNVIVKSVKTKKEVANKTVDFNAGFLTFDNEIPVHDTYSVSVRANLHYKSNDTYEVVWAGVSPEIYVYSNEETAQRSIANEVQIGLKFLTIEFVKLYPAKLVFEPELPLAELVKGTIIPPFRVKVIEQFGNVLSAASGDIRVELHNGAFKSGVTSKSLSAGVASFSEMAVSEVVPDSQGFVKLEASFSGVTGYSQPMKAIGAVIPNASVAGYLSDATASPAAMPANDSNVSFSPENKTFTPVRAASAGKQVFLVADNVEYQTVTDLKGFYKFDVKLSGDLTPVKMTFQGPAGPIVSNMSAIKGKTQIVIAKIDASGNMRLQKAVLEGNYTEALDPAAMEKLVEAEIARIKSSATGATGISGRIISGNDGYGLPGVSVNIKENGESVVSGTGGIFNFSPANGLKAGVYNITVAKSDFVDSAIAVSITEDDYGFSYDGSIIALSPVPLTPPVLKDISISGITGEINITYSIDDQDKTHLCGVEVYYSIDGGLSYFNKASVSGDLSGIASGSGKKITWHSTADFLSKQTSVRLKLIPFDPRSQGTPVESNVFEVDNLLLTDNKIPSITSVIASGNSGEIQLNFDLADGDNDSCSIELYYSLDDGASLKRSINLVDISKRHFPGTNLKVVWDSYKDIKTNQKSVKVRLVPNDSKTSGSWGESQVFELKNLINTPPAVSRLTVSGIKENITLTYDIIDLDNNLCTAEVYFSTDAGLSFKKSLNITGDTREITGGTGKKVVWNSKLDIADNAEGVIIKIVPSDEFGYGSEAVSEPVPVYNLGFRPQISNLSTAGSSNNITVSYDILDKDSALCSVEVYFSKDGGASFAKAAEISGDTSVVMIAGTLSTAKKIIWNSIRDFKTNEANVRIKLSASDETGAGTEAVSLVFAVNNTGFRPVISNFTTVGTSGEIALNYDLADLDSSPCFIEVQYGINNAAYIKTLNLYGDTQSVSAGTGKSLIWNSKADISGTANNVTLKLIVSDAGGPGTESVSLPFTVNNNSKPIASNVKTAGNAGNITVTYDLADANNDTCSVELYYSTDGGTVYKKAAGISQPITGVTPGTGKSLVWNSIADLGQQNFPGVKLNILPYDAFSSGTTAESTVFAVNNFVQLVPTLQSAEFYSADKILLKFNTAVSATGADETKISYMGTPFSAAAIETNPANNNSLFIRSTDGPFSEYPNSNGSPTHNSVTLEMQSGNGIMGQTGGEVSPTSAPLVIGTDVTVDPITDILQYLSYTKADGSGFVSCTNAIDYPEEGRLQIYAELYNVDPLTPPAPYYEPESSNLRTESVSITGHSANDIIISGISGTENYDNYHVYYRFIDMANNKTPWAVNGTVRKSSIFNAVKQNISWSNFENSIILSNNFGANLGIGEKINVYELNGSTYSLVGSTTISAPAGGYVDGKYHVLNDSSMEIQITGGLQFAFTIAKGNNESGYITDGIVPAIPSTPAQYLRLRYNTSFADNYELKNIDGVTNVSLDNDLRVYLIDGSGILPDIRLGRINKSAVATIGYGTFAGGNSIADNNKYDPSESDPNGDGLKQIAITSDRELKFTYVDPTSGNESDYAFYNGGMTVIPPPDASKMIWQNHNIAFRVTSDYIGAPGDILTVYKKSGASYSLVGSAPQAGPSGYDSPNNFALVGPPAPITANNIVSYTIIDTDSNESLLIDDGPVPASPDVLYSTFADYLTIKHDPLIKYTIFNGYAGPANVTGTNPLKVYIGPVEAGTISGNISASSFFPQLIQPYAPGGMLTFVCLNAEGNESSSYGSKNVPPAPTPENTGLVNWNGSAIVGVTTPVTTFSPSSVIKLYTDDDGVIDNTNTHFYRQTSSNVHNLTNMTLNFVNDITGNGVAWTPIAAHTFIGYSVYNPTDQTESRISFKETIPAAPDASYLSASRAAGKVKYLAGVSEIGNNLPNSIIVYQDADGPGGSAAVAVSGGKVDNVNFGIDGTITPSSITTGQYMAYSVINPAGNESVLAYDGVIPNAPTAPDTTALEYSKADNEVRSNAIFGDVSSSDLYLNLYGFDNSATNTYYGKADDPNGVSGYPANSLIIPSTSITGTIPDFHTVKYTYTDSNGNESDFTSDGVIPAAPTAAAIKAGSDNNNNYISGVSQSGPIVTISPVNGQISSDLIYAKISDGTSSITNLSGGAVNSGGAPVDVTMATASSLNDGPVTVKAYIKNAEGNSSLYFNGTAGNKDAIIPAISSWSVNMNPDGNDKNFIFTFNKPILSSNFNLSNVTIADNSGTNQFTFNTAIKNPSGNNIMVNSLGKQAIIDLNTALSANGHNISNGVISDIELLLAANAIIDPAGNKSIAVSHGAGAIMPSTFSQDATPPTIISWSMDMMQDGGNKCIDINTDDYISTPPIQGQLSLVFTSDNAAPISLAGSNVVPLTPQSYRINMLTAQKVDSINSRSSIKFSNSTNYGILVNAGALNDMGQNNCITHGGFDVLHPTTFTADNTAPQIMTVIATSTTLSPSTNDHILITYSDYMSSNASMAANYTVTSSTGTLANAMAPSPSLIATLSTGIGAWSNNDNISANPAATDIAGNPVFTNFKRVTFTNVNAADNPVNNTIGL